MTDRQTEFTERRKHKRFEVKSGVTAAIIEPDSGNDYIYRGKIINISQGGLALQHICSNGESKEPFELDILVIRDILCFKYLKKIPFRTVWVSNMATETAIDDLNFKTRGLQFDALMSAQILMLDMLLHKYTIR